MLQKLIPPFNQETARAKVKAAEDGWNSCDPLRVAKAYSLNSDWRRRDMSANDIEIDKNNRRIGV